MKKSFLIFTILVAVNCGGRTDNDAAQHDAADERVLALTPEQSVAIAYTTVNVEKKAVWNTLHLNGFVDVPPENLVSVSSALGGYIKSTKVLPGLHFDKGEILAVMEDNQYILLQEEFLKTKAQLALAGNEYNRQLELNKTKAGSDKVLQQAEMEYETLRITEKVLREKLLLININPDKVSVDTITRSINIYAPFDGYVTDVFVNVGKYVSSAEVLFELVDASDLHLNLKVFEQDWDKIYIGQPLLASSLANPSKKYEGELIQIGRSISSERVVEIHAHLENYDEHIIPGMYMSAELKVSSGELPSLPNEGIVTYEGAEYVFADLGDNRFEMVKVQTGVSGDEWTEVKNAEVLEGVQIVQKGAYVMLMALKTEIED